MAAKVTNNAFGTLSAGITTSSTTISLSAGQGARFPALGAGDYFYATLVDTANNIEIVKATARSVDSMTVVRAQDGTTAKAYQINDRLELRPIAALFNEKVDLETITTVPRGGTGQTTLPTNSVLVGNGTAAVGAVAPGTSGNVLTSSGGTWVSSTPPVGGLTVVVLTASQQWTKPASVSNFFVTIHAGGGGGGNDAFSGSGSPGGVGGFAYALITSAEMPSTVSVTIGDGGAVLAPGQPSSFGSLLSATGGTAGVANSVVTGNPGTGTVTTGIALAVSQVGATPFTVGPASTQSTYGGFSPLPNLLSMFKNPYRLRGSGTTATPYVHGGTVWPGAAGQGDLNIQNNGTGGVNGACFIIY
jgi:hypothetical protein